MNVDWWIEEPKTPGKAQRSPALIVGRQVHTMAVVTSIEVQRVVGILVHVGSDVSPKDLRV
jgi:hypothetical protein